MSKHFINNDVKTSRPNVAPSPQHPRVYNDAVCLRVIKPDGSINTYTFDTITEADAFKRGVMAVDIMGACAVVDGDKRDDD